MRNSVDVTPNGSATVPRRIPAKSLMITGGRGQQSDLEVVAKELDKWPDGVLQAALTGNTKVVVCRDTITDYATELKGVHPRNWPPGATWDSIAGISRPDGQGHNTVILAVVGYATGNTHVPGSGEGGQGSYNVAIHEFAHAVDYCGVAAVQSKSAAFQAARTADLATLSGYESATVPAGAGSEETWAESAARYYGGDPTDATQHPHLHAFWAAHTVGPSVRPNPAPDQTPGQTNDGASASLGHGEMLGDGTINLHLKALGANGERGCAMVTYTKDHPLYSKMVAHLGDLTPGNSAPYSPWPDGDSSAAA